MQRIPAFRLMNAPQSGRRGAVLILALMAVLLVTLMSHTMLETGLQHRRQVRRYERQLQSSWFVEAGLERAAAHLQRDPDYQGETWHVPADNLAGRHSATVEIRLRDAEPPPRRWSVSVVCRLHTDGGRAYRTEKRLFVTPEAEQAE